MHQFDPDASPAEKAAATLKGTPSTASVDMSALPSLRGPELKDFKQQGGSELVTAPTSGKGIKTTTNLKEVEALAVKQDEGRPDEAGIPSPPGALPTKEGNIRESESESPQPLLRSKSSPKCSLMFDCTVPDWFAIVRMTQMGIASELFSLSSLRRDGRDRKRPSSSRPRKLALAQF